MQTTASAPRSSRLPLHCSYSYSPDDMARSGRGRSSKYQPVPPGRRQTRHISLQRIRITLTATGCRGLPNTYAIPKESTQTSINVGSDWIFVASHDQSQYYGVIKDLRALTHDTVEYVVHCALPTKYFFLLVERKRTNNPSRVTQCHRALKPHLRDSQRFEAPKYPWHVPQSPSTRREHAPQEGHPMHHTVAAQCISRSGDERNPSVWKVTRTNTNDPIRVGMYIDLHDTDDPCIPVGPARITGVHNLERNWVEFSASIHPHYNRTSCTYLLLAAPANQVTLPDNLAFFHSSMRHLLPDVYGNEAIFPPTPPTPVLRRIQSALATLRIPV